MTAKKFTWRSVLPTCYKPESPSPKTKKVRCSKQNSFQRISLSDLSNPNSIFSEDLSISLAGSNLHVFTLMELKDITQNFSSSNFIGEGGFGPVHKGFIDDKLRPGLMAQPVAVKLLDLDGSQGHREWLVSIFYIQLYLIMYLNFLIYIFALWSCRFKWLLILAFLTFSPTDRSYFSGAIEASTPCETDWILLWRRTQTTRIWIYAKRKLGESIIQKYAAFSSLYIIKLTTFDPCTFTLFFSLSAWKFIEN